MRKGLISVAALLSISSLSVASPYEPAARTPGEPYGALTVTAKSAIVMDAASGKVLWAKDADTPRYPASTTKIMTALLLLENCKLDEMITAPADIETVTESSLHLKPFEQISVRDMLYSLMLRSANDGAYAVASHVSGSVEAFAKLMNARANQLGAVNTSFTNPHGLRDEKHLTTARDLALIAREAMKNPVFREVVRTPRYKISRSINKGDELLISKNRLLRLDPTLEGIKTGFTIPAGRCYVGSATRDGYRLITVVLNSQDWQLDSERLLEWAYANHRRIPIVKAGQVLGRAQVSGGEDEAVAFVPLRDVDSVLPLSSIPPSANPQFVIQPLTAPINKGQQIGTATFIEPDGFANTVPILAAADLKASTPLLAAAVSSPTVRVLAGLAIGAYVLRRRSRRRRSYARPSKSHQAPTGRQPAQRSQRRQW